MPTATVTTTVAVACTANIGVTRRPRWSHRSRATTKIHQATPSFPRPAGWERVPTGPSSGAPCPYPRRESRVVQPNELLLNGIGHQGRLFPRHITTKAIHEGVHLGFYEVQLSQNWLNREMNYNSTFNVRLNLCFAHRRYRSVTDALNFHQFFLISPCPNQQV